MKVKIVQLSSGPDVQQNIEKSIRLASQGEKADLIVFPEYQMIVPDFANPGFTIRQAESEEGVFVTAMRELSKDSGSAVLCNGTILDGKNRVLNRSLFLENGEISFRYDKTHLYDAMNSRESAVYSYGLLPYRGHRVSEFTIGPLICYDLRFPEAARALRLRGARVITYQSGWFSGQGKKDQWITLLSSRAIENGCYVIGAAQTGDAFTGNSAVIDPKGAIVARLGKEEGILEAQLSAASIEEYDRNYPLVEQRRTDLYSSL